MTTNIIEFGRIYKEDLAQGNSPETVILADGQPLLMHPLLDTDGMFPPLYGGFGQDISGKTGVVSFRAGTPYFSPLWVSVTEYGAIGDGVTDDTAALQAAIDAATATGTKYGAVLLEPNATYAFSGLNLRRYLMLAGFGCGSKLLYTGTGPALTTDATLSGDNDTMANVMNSVLRDFYVYTTTGATGLLIQNAKWMHVSRVKVEGFSTANFHLYGTATDRECINITLEDVQSFGGAGDGILLSGTNNLAGNRIIRPRILSAGGHGIRTTSIATSLLIDAPDIENTTDAPISIEIGYAVTVRSPYIECKTGSAYPAIEVGLTNIVAGFLLEGGFLQGAGIGNTATLVQLGSGSGSVVHGAVVKGVTMGYADAGVTPTAVDGCEIGPNALVKTDLGVVTVTNAIGTGTLNTKNLKTIFECSNDSSRAEQTYSMTGATGLPTMTTDQKNALAPMTGALVFDTDLAKAQVYTGSTWESLH